MRVDIARAARLWIGTPYMHQASLRHVGCDCLGLLRGVWRDVVGPEPEVPPPYSRDWAEAGRRDVLIDTARRHLVVACREVSPGDVLVFRWRAHLPAKHCAIVGEAARAGAPATMIHAHEGAAVAEVALTPYWARHIAGHFAFPNPEAP